MTTGTPFDLAAPLPAPGTRMLLEASAGTGKTYAIVTLAVRYLLEGRATLPELLLITFTRDATQELRSRLREHLTRTAADLAADRPAGDDPVLIALDRDGLREVARARIQAALGDYDRAIIATTHEFCATMLTELGMLADHDVSELLAEERDAFVHELGVDCWLRRFSTHPRITLPIKAKSAEIDALKIAKRVTGDSGAALWPPRDHPDLHDDQRDQVGYAHDVREEFERRKRLLRVQTFDDLQDRLRDALTNPVTGARVAARLRERFPVVMVDEFQDTDPVQWQVLRDAFDGHSTMVLIGDPKQAIYSFRGADVHAYLDARAGATRIHTLDRNWRTDEPVQRALDALFRGAALGAGIEVNPVRSAHPGRLFTADGTPAAPMRLELVIGRHGDAWAAHRPIAQQVADHIASVLLDPPVLDLPEGRRPATPGDLAVLVRTKRMGELVRDALQRRRVPVVYPKASGVFSSAAADYWETLLSAVDDPAFPKARALAVTPLIGWSLAELANADEGAEAELIRQVRQWGRVLAADGVAALFDAVQADRDLPRRVLATEGGERLLTDLRHLAQSLHRAQRGQSLNVTGLLDWLRNRRQAPGTDDEEPRRLETDSDVVHISTLHGAKGLEFPLVFLPDTWQRFQAEKLLPTYHDRAGGPAQRMLDVSGPTGRAFVEHRERAHAEQFDEDLRLFYVGATRARHQVTLWWADVAGHTRLSPLQRLLFGSFAPGTTPPTEGPDLTEPLPSGLPHLSRAGADVRVANPGSATLPIAAAPADTRLAARVLDRTIDRQWRRTSYSGLTAQVHAQGPNVSSEPPMAGTQDEPDLAAEPVIAPESVREAQGTPSPMAQLPTGTRFGTLVHSIFEDVDFRAPDLPAEVRRHAAGLLARMPMSGVDADTLATGLLPALLTSLGPLAAGRRLADVPVTDRLPELDFDYPLTGGDSPRGAVTVGDIGRLLAAGLPADDPLVAYPAMLLDPLLADESLRGFLTGSIDAVLRFTEPTGPSGTPIEPVGPPTHASGTPGEPDNPQVSECGTPVEPDDPHANESGTPVERVGPPTVSKPRESSTTRYVVVDYKTNWLGTPGSELLVEHYHADALAAAMMHSHYPLQALLYQVALHRFLRWRQPGYDPAAHLGGVLYLFVRGMAGPATPAVAGVPHGVFSWRPPAALIVELSDLIAGRGGA